MRTAAERLQLVDDIFTEAADRGLMLQTPEDHALDGRTIVLDGRPLVNFGSCSYLGLEMDPRLKQGVIDAVTRYGTQFSSSRSYLSAPPYAELEPMLDELFGGSVLVAPSTTLGHLSTLPVLVGEHDVVILDQQVHHSVTQAANLLRAQGTAVEVVRHSRMDLLEERVAELARHHPKVWYMADGVYSMFADCAPVEELGAMLDRHEQMQLYVDDSHGMSWSGRHGRGYVLGRMPIRDRMIVAASLNKAFAAAGGAFVFSDPELRRKVRTVGGTMVFSGPVQPPMLGAALASARVHLTPEIEGLQQTLSDRVALCNRLMLEHDLPLVAPSEAPIRYVGCGLPRVANAMAVRLMDEGIYVNPAPFPAVPMKQCGIRAPITVHHTEADIHHLVEAIAEHLPAVLREHESSPESVRAAFGLAAPAETTPAPTAQGPSELRVEMATTIGDLDAAEWDRLLGDAGTFSARGLAFLEGTFAGGGRPEDDWTFRYFVVRDADGAPLLATFFTATLWKDDMLATAAVSRVIEARRANDPYYLTSRTFAMGSLLTEGGHLWLDRDRDWQGALTLLLDAAAEEQVRLQASTLVLRDFFTHDEEVAAFLRERGFVQVSMLESLVLDVDFDSDEEFLAGLSPRARAHQRRQVLPREGDFEVEVLVPGGRVPSEEELDHLYGLYRNVEARGLDLNSFDLPRSVLRRMLEDDCWELFLLRLRPEAGGPQDGRPVAFGACFVGRAHYSPMVVGLDYDYVFEHGAYRRALLETVRRSQHLGVEHIYMGMGATLEKRRFGARPEPRCAFVRADDHFSLEVLANAEADASAGAAGRAGNVAAVGRMVQR